MDSRAIASLGELNRYFSMVTYGVGSEEQTLMQIYALRYEIYCLECGFLAEDHYPDGLERDAYDIRSAHFAAENRENMVAGTVRLVLGRDDESFPFEEFCGVYNDFCAPPAAMSAEVSRLAVHKHYRRRIGDTKWGFNEAKTASPVAGVERRANCPMVVLGLYRQMYRYSREHGIRYWYAAMEKSLARALARFDFVFVPIGPETNYYGPVIPYIADLSELEDRLQRTKPDLLAWFRSGD